MKKTFKEIFILLFILFMSANLSAQDIDPGVEAAKKGDYVKAVNLLKNAVNGDDSYEGYYYYGLSLMNTGSMTSKVSH